VGGQGAVGDGGDDLAQNLGAHIAHGINAGKSGAGILVGDDIGKRIARGESIEITKEDLTRAGKTGWYLEDRDQEAPSRIRRCAACGFATGEDYDYCPKCGSPLE